MIIVLKPGSTKQDADELLEHIEKSGCKPLYMPGTERIVLGAIGDERILGALHFDSYPQVESTTEILSPYKLVSRELHPHDTVISMRHGVTIGAEQFLVIAGPCAVESSEQMMSIAADVKAGGASCLRGGAFKPRTSPYSFQGHGEQGLIWLEEAAASQGMPSVTEVVELADVALVARHADVLQVGARNMQNFRLLQALGHCGKPVILKRGMAASLSDLLHAAEYIVSEGNPDVILCERGIRTFETATRNTLDLSAVPWIKQRSHLPVVVDPSHATGLRELVAPMARAAAACGADGLMVEVHPDPPKSSSDGRQSLYPEQFVSLMQEMAPFVTAAGRRL